jgi:rhodanese-related sulfurtransferase
MPRTASFYCFADLPDHAERVAPLQALCTELDVRGNILLAAEGINGSIAGDDRAVQAVLDHLREDPRLAALAVRSADCAEVPLHRLKVRSKREIVTLGVPGLDPVGQTGTHVPPSEWNALLQRPGLVLLDVRNDYEVAIGSFEGAVDPQTAAFTDWPAWIAWLARVSYPVFLVHFSVLLAVGALWRLWWPTQPLANGLGMLLVFVVSLWGGAALQRLEQGSARLRTALGWQLAVLVAGLLAISW